MSDYQDDWRTTSFAAIAMRMILQNPLKDETATNRLKQIGFMGIMYQMHLMQLNTTVKQIMEVSHLSRAGIFEVAEPLIERGLLGEEKVLNFSGRGRATRLFISADLLKQIDDSSPFART